ncbi:protein-glutamate methylesterase/protein-glutamine glutaminase [Pseudohongiella nitratireducens]|uniref:protein-glutamate methylesterase/protein-glutamine glutaminase n=1 Tax=Pseudohongiella nitratireducens TaxID=1768907 RepID=UPI00240A89AD|nr:chemotaxis response regulator protein-glutamate methylesterase [Pseudohongiella nitratireducens]MDF1623615.1 chemotaxis response regulator protein-glutamate methylesterase [Pseudohongiella nitratireducens]|tara:strand:- start:1578 stop:2669 length:1092 start_codon:yes stop_codon:yes gene_type:complete
MTTKVLVVDDSGFFRRRLTDLINKDHRMAVVGTAENGQEALAAVERLKPDVVTMDYEMPVMDGITAVREISKKFGTPVLMFSSLTYEGARVTLDALEAGAVDYLPKNFEDISRHADELQRILCDRLQTIARAKVDERLQRLVPGRSDTAVKTATGKAAEDKPADISPARGARTKSGCKLLVIGASTGGPMALQEVLTQLPATFPVPVLLVQHMPEAFTKAFAERLNRICALEIKEASDGDVLRPGCAYLAPGGKQMLVETRQSLILKVVAGDERLNYKPSLDVTFGSAARELGSAVLGVVLTGMGADGREGARMLKSKGSRIWAQDEATSVIYGMPMAVAKAGLTDRILALRDVPVKLREELQ